MAGGLIQFANFAQSNLAGAISNVAVSANLTSGSGVLFPSPTNGQYFVMVLNDQATGLIYEIVHVTNVTGDTITMVRGQEGTTAENWNAGDIVLIEPTAGQMAVLGQVLTYPGNPNGHVAGVAATGGLPPTFCWDSTDGILYACTTTGSAGSAVWAPANASLFGSQLAHGECYLSYVSTTSILLAPKNGQNILSAGIQYHLAAAGVSAANTGVMVNGTPSSNLVASTAYLVSYNGAANTLKFWAVATYAHAPDTTAGNVGIEVITFSGTPMSAETLVGLAITDASSHFQVQGTGTVSYFQPVEIYILQTPFTASTSSGSFVELSSSERVHVASIANRPVKADFNSTVSNTVTPGGGQAAIALDGVVGGAIGTQVTVVSASEVMYTGVHTAFTIDENVHYLSPFALSNGGSGTATFIGNLEIKTWA